MQYINLPFEFLDDENEKAENKLLVSAASDRTFMLKLSDGKLIMINGGWRDAAWSRYNHDDLMKKLFGEMQYFAGSDTVQIAAYIMTKTAIPLPMFLFLCLRSKPLIWQNTAWTTCFLTPTAMEHTKPPHCSF